MTPELTKQAEEEVAKEAGWTKEGIEVLRSPETAGARLEMDRDSVLAMFNLAVRYLAEKKEMEGALKEAIHTIRIWHGMGEPKAQEEFLWKVYSEQSPEMKRILSVFYSHPSVDELKRENARLKGTCICMDCGVVIKTTEQAEHLKVCPKDHSLSPHSEKEKFKPSDICYLCGEPKGDLVMERTKHGLAHWHCIMNRYSDHP